MNFKKVSLVAVIAAAAFSSGCASYRTSSNVDSKSIVANKSDEKVIISEGQLPDKKYKEIGPIEVSIKKLTVFHKDPTKEQANEALSEKAKEVGANAVINVTYKSGIGFTTWGYMDAKGTGVKFTN
ncbi:heavy metal-binding domain-containing protein [Crenobacter cavernae]|uniref:Heavy metal-binding domain-containing protein n=1 Tax=Crenobacter cavernae TaxID=2290923 RepID=A0A345Y4W2_9NEIS|nr:heavy metal-binding domain-containing protein [Crenobacter cavernae]AXK38964.1 hypothetical protein DWG20_05680 [Crenobacter cavernae]